MKNPKIDIIVTRNSEFARYLRDIGLASEDTPVITKAEAADVRGKHVAGTLPHWLVAEAATFTEIPLRLSPEDRAAMHRGDLGLDRVRAISGEPVTYTSRKGWTPTDHIPVVRKQHPSDERDEILEGGDRTASGDYYVHPMALRSDIAFDTSDYSYYRDGGSWTLIGRTNLDLVEAEMGRWRAKTYRETPNVIVAVIAAVEWRDLSDEFAGEPDGVGKPVAIEQAEPLVFTLEPHPSDSVRMGLLPVRLTAPPRIKEWRVRHYAIQSVGEDLRGRVGLDLFAADRDDCPEFEVGPNGGKSGDTLMVRARNFNEAGLIRIMQRTLTARLGVPVSLV